jgi:hypothetical protein
MTTTHAIDVLLSKLPLKALLAHSLPSLVNNLLSVAVLCNAGCKVFFKKTGCKVTFDEGTILQGWRDPQNCLWCVMIVNNGWTTKITISNVTRPVTPLSTTPTGHLANSMPILPSKSNMTLANSLYKRSNMGQLTNYYYASLIYPIKSTLTEAIDRGLLDSFSAKLPNHGNRDSHVNTFPLFQQSLEKAGIAARGNLPPLARPSIV